MPKLDIVDFTKKYKGELWEFYLDVDEWRTFTRRHPMTWQKVRFSDRDRASVPKVRGIYAFTVELSPTIIPTHGYILYVGIAGHKSAGNLHRRFGDYLREQVSEKKRPAVRFMLRNWQGDLFFNFVPLPDRRLSLKKLETEILDAIRPPVNELDFSADIIAVRKAAF